MTAGREEEKINTRTSVGQAVSARERAGERERRRER